MEQYKISIIIAMYNIQDFIIECLDSCFYQQAALHEDYEVILVNDGSTDNSLELASAFIFDKPNFRIISQVNQGLSSARNAGIRHAKGEYLWFVDGDDTIAPNAINILINNIDQTHCDAYIHNFSTFERESEILQISSFNLSDDIFNGKDYHDEFLRFLPQMAWLTVYKRSFLEDNNLFYIKDILHEDFEFSIRAHHLCKRIRYIPSALYLYRVNRTGSIMNCIKKDNTKALLSYITILKSHQSFFRNENSSFARAVYSYSAMSFFKGVYCSSFIINETTTQLLESKKKLYRILWNSNSLKHRCYLLMLIFFPPCFLRKINEYISAKNGL